MVASIVAMRALAVEPVGPSETVQLDVEPVWSAHPVGFCLLTHPPAQFVAYYDAERRMSIAQRQLDSTNWTITKLPSTLGWDSHNYVTMALDRRGGLHLSGNMHGVPLVYFRSEEPLNASSLRQVQAMTGDRERRMTYPVFLRDREGRLIFRYRDGGSGNGDDLYNVYDEQTGSWRRLLDQPLTSGQGRMNAYCSVPRQGPDGRFHMVWVWRDTPDCASNHDLSYARSDDLVRWMDSAGRPLSLPITVKTGDIIDPVPPGGGLLNVNRELGFDNAGRPVMSYHKCDAQGDLQVYAARRETNRWNIVQVSDWTGYRWNFGGGGTVVVEVRVGAVRPLGDGRLALSYRYPHGAGIWVLDEATLRPIPGATAPPEEPLVPPAFAKVESTFPGMKKRIRQDTGQPPPGTRFAIGWETLEPNRDRPRPTPWPEPSMLRVVRTKTTTANLAPGDTPPTEVVLIGALHDFHRKNPHYTLEALLGIIVSCKPQAILVELPETSHGKPTVRDGRLVEEYAKRNEFWACQQAADKLNVSIHPFDMDLLDDIRQETRYWERTRQAERGYAAFLAAHRDDDILADLRAHERFEEDEKRSILAFAEKGTPEIINSEAFDSVLRARKRLQPIVERAIERAIQAHPEQADLLHELQSFGREWQRRNASMAVKIEGYAKQYQSKRIVVVVGAEHRHLLRDLLQNSGALTCKEYWEIP